MGIIPWTKAFRDAASYWSLIHDPQVYFAIGKWALLREKGVSLELSFVTFF